MKLIYKSAFNYGYSNSLREEASPFLKGTNLLKAQ